MAVATTLNAQERPRVGTRGAKQARKQGLVPAVVYGHKEATVSLSVAGDELRRAVRTGVRLVDLKIGAKASEKALIREVQWDHLGMEILHVDFARISADEKIKVDVRVEIRGQAPGVTQGGNLVQPLHSLHVECLAIAIPDSIRVAIGELQLNQAIHVKELKLPDGVKVLNDPDAIVVQVSPPKEEAATPAVPGAEGAEPEVIGRAKGEEEEGEAEK